MGGNVVRDWLDEHGEAGVDLSSRQPRRYAGCLAGAAPCGARVSRCGAAVADELSGECEGSSGGGSVFELARLWWELRKWRPDVLVYLGPVRGVKAARRDAAFFRLCGVRKMVG